MKTKRLNSVDMFHREFEDLRGNVIYRGVRDASYPLVTSFGRMKHIKPKERGDVEKWIFDEFKRKSRPHITSPPTTDWDWMALAQHYGLPTRLLDWSENPLIAAYFAVAQPSDTDSAIYIWRNNNYISADDETSPFDFNKIAEFTPAHIDKRITAQAGVFTFHPYPFRVFRASGLMKVVIPAALRGQLKRQLNRYGVSAASVFPGPDGVAEQLKWDQGPDDLH